MAETTPADPNEPIITVEHLTSNESPLDGALGDQGLTSVDSAPKTPVPAELGSAQSVPAEPLRVIVPEDPPQVPITQSQKQSNEKLNQSDPTVSNNHAEENAVIGKLLFLARQNHLTDAISTIQAYDAAAEHSQNVAVLEKMARSCLDNAATFLKITITDCKGKKLFENRNKLADRIVLAIESYFPATCMTCKSSYCVDI